MINSKKSEAFDEGTNEFPYIDVESAKRELNLVKKAEENGRDDIPRSNTKEKDAIATNIDTYLADFVARAQDKYNTRIRAIDDLTNRQSETFGQEVKDIFESGRVNLRATARYYYTDLINARRKWILGQDEYNVFREKHNRVGPATYPNKAQTIFTYTLLMLFVLLEAILSAWTLGSAHPGGYFGVARIVFIFSTLSVILSFGVGWLCIPRCLHCNILCKLVGIISSVIVISIIVGGVFALVHYRDAIISSTPDQYTNATFESLINTPIYLDDIKSYGILVLSLVCAFASGFKGYRFDDPYPGYGKIERDQEYNINEFNEKQTVAFKDSIDLVDDFSQQLIEKVAAMRSYQVAVEQRRDDKETLHIKYTTWVANIQIIGDDLYSYYREKNLKYRKSKTTPKTFTLHSYQTPKDAQIDPPVRIEVSETFRKEYKKIKDECNKHLEILNANLREYQTLFEDAKTISSGEIVHTQTMIPTIFRE